MEYVTEKEVVFGLRHHWKGRSLSHTQLTQNPMNPYDKRSVYSLQTRKSRIMINNSYISAKRFVFFSWFNDGLR
jgi:hypothetical protein